MALEPAAAESDFVILDSDGLLAYLGDAPTQHDVYQALTGVLRQRLEMKLAATADGITRLEAVAADVSSGGCCLPAYESVQAEGGGAPLPIGVDVPDMSA